MALARVRGPGQPDQACDLVAAMICEEYLRRDPTSRLNVHVSGGQGALFVAGDVRSTADFDVSAIVQRVLGQLGTGASVEPFIAFEPMSAEWAPEVGTREVASAFGYATDATRDRLPPAVSMARDVAQELERRRTSDPDWFWLGADCEVTVEDRRGKSLVVIRAQHVDTMEVGRVREQIKSLIEPRLSGAELRVNVAGEEIRAGLSARMGASGLVGAAESFGTAIPPQASGAGKHLSHPSNLGNWFARAAAIELVAAKKGKGVMVNLTWLPLESRPHEIRIRNERGEDLSSLVDASRFDLNRAPQDFLRPELLSASLRAPFDGSAGLPWEIR